MRQFIIPVHAGKLKFRLACLLVDYLTTLIVAIPDGVG
jgi:hypothetical protein